MREYHFLAVIHLLRIEVVVHHAVIGHLNVFSAWLAVVAVRVDAEAAAWQEFTPYFDVFGIHQGYEVFHDDVHAVLMKSPVITEAEEIQLQALAFDQLLIGNISQVDGSKVRLTGYGAKAGKFGTIEFDHRIVLRMLVIEAFQHFRGIFKQIFAFVSEIL